MAAFFNLAMDGRKEKFDLALAETEEGKSFNASRLLPRNEYESIDNRMSDLEKPEVKRTRKDYHLLRKYDVMEISVEGITVRKLIKKGTVLRYVCAEDLFDTIQAAHLANGHGGRNIADSMGHGQGFIKCNCSKFCQNNRGKCYKNKNMCNSRCKCGSACGNRSV